MRYCATRIPKVYYKIPLRRLLGEEASAAAGQDGRAVGVRAPGEQEVVQGRPLSDRLSEPGCVETRLVALRLLGAMSAEEFRKSIGETGGKVRGPGGEVRDTPT